MAQTANSRNRLNWEVEPSLVAAYPRFILTASISLLWTFPPGMANRLRSGFDLAWQNISKLPGLHFCAQAQVMFAQDHLGVSQGGHHDGGGRAGGGTVPGAAI